VLGNIIASGIKLMVLAIIIGIGSTIFGEITSTFEPGNVSLEQAASVILGSLSLLALGIFGPGIANGLVTGAPQLGAGAAVATAAGVGAGAVAGGLAAKGAAGVAGQAATGSVKAAASLGGAAQTAYSLGSAASGGGAKGVASGVAGVAAAGAGHVKGAIGNAASRIKSSLASRAQGGSRAAFKATGGSGVTDKAMNAANDGHQPDWAQKIRSSQTRRDAALTAASAARAGDSPGSGTAVRLKDNEE
jgi:type IV secretion system protein TrbL